MAEPTSIPTPVRAAPDDQEPRTSTTAPPSLPTAVGAWVQLAGLTTLANLGIYAIASALGATMTAELGSSGTAVEPIAVIIATLATLFISTMTWTVVAHRVPAFAALWVPLGFGVGLVSLGGILGASDLSTGVALGAMHLLTTAVAALAIPHRLPR